jgi:methylmalonyl-CoA mutase
MTDPILTNEFPPASRDEWLRRVEGVLKGADFKRKLVGRTYDGIEIQPVYPKADGSRPVIREEPGAWRISQPLDHPDPAAANALALADLSGGADALTVVAQKAPSARGFGLSLRSIEDLDRALAGIMLDLIHVRLDAGGRGRQVAAMFVALAERRGHVVWPLSVDVRLEHIGDLAVAGRLSASWDQVAARMVETQAALAARGFAGRMFLADGRPYHEAGASEAQELAAVLATGIAYLRALEAGGIPLDAARDALAFLLVADADEFLTVAKFRALRRLWARVEQGCGLEPKPLRLHAETAWRMTTRRDPWVNMLRTTVATFSAGLGGADAISVIPFTSALGLADGFARRVARNTQLILMEEANLARVADPAAGAGGFEALTDALCEKAWGLFQTIEGGGGIIQNLKRGSLQQEIASVRAEREKAVATRREPMTGTSEFPNLSEGNVAVLLRSPLWDPPAGHASDPGAKPAGPTTFAELVAKASSGVTLAELSASALGVSPVAVDPLPSIRAAEPFERLRDRSDAALARTGQRPRVFLATLGPPATYTGRAGFAKNFFQTGGIETVMPEGASSAEAVAAAFKDSGAAMICLCSSDDLYAKDGVAALAALRPLTEGPLYVAGRPADLIDSFTKAGATGFIHAGCNAVAVLQEALASVGA